MISSLPGKALRMIVESRGLLSDSTCILKVEPGKLDIKRQEPGIIFTLQTRDNYKRKYVHELLVNSLFKPAQEKVLLGELTVPP